MTIIYQIAEAVFQKQISLIDGINKMVLETKMPSGSAKIILRQVYPGLRKGEVFTRTLSASLFDFLLKNIQNDFGNKDLQNSLNALQLHIIYCQQQGYAKNKLTKILNRYHHELGMALDKIVDEIEQDELIEKIGNQINTSEIINELENISQQDPVIIFFAGKAYKRDNRTIALIKILRGQKCQICETSIIKKNGQKYVEAAHIIPKREKGPETADNIILLCPNHHKEFDYGDFKEISKSKEDFRFMLNGKEYYVNLTSNVYSI